MSNGFVAAIRLDWGRNSLANPNDVPKPLIARVSWQRSKQGNSHPGSWCATTIRFWNSYRKRHQLPDVFFFVAVHVGHFGTVGQRFEFWATTSFKHMRR